MSIHIVQEFFESIIGFFQDNIWISLLLSLAFGLLMSLTPCCLAHTGMAMRCSDADSSIDRFKNSFVFALGGVLVFAIVSVLVWVIGEVLNEVDYIFHIFVGTLTLVVVVWALFFDKRHKKRHHHNLDNTEKCFDKGKDCICDEHMVSCQTKKRIFFHGIAGSFFSFPCSIPILLAIITLATGLNNSAIGIAMITLFIIGHSILPVVASVFFKTLNNSNVVLNVILKYIKIILLVFLVFYALYTIYDGVSEAFDF
ncbi:MAG: hypothetical protein LBU60_00900 [Clostridiales bacterium]|jgi:cytochrome c biogenesis protein CcdA|nr:hypothetical protein [Clostridiales bacterium]